MLDAISIITIIGLAQGFFLLSLLLLQKQKNQVTFFAIGLLVIFILDLGWYFVYLLDQLDQHWYLVGQDSVVLYLYGPMLYFYVKSHFSSNHQSISKVSLIKHFTPAILVLFLVSPLFFRTATINFLDHFKTALPDTLAAHSLLALLFDFFLWFTHVIVYLVLTIRFIKKVKLNQKHYEQNMKNQHLRWVLTLFICYLAFSLLMAVDFFFASFLAVNFNSYSLANIVIVLHIFVMSYIGFTNQELLLHPLKKVSRSNTNLAKLDLQKLDTDLQTLMEQEKLYLQPSLSLNDVAQDLNISSHQLSEFLNQETQQTFNDFINSYRIQDAKTLLQQPQSQLLTIEAIAYEVGFNSPSTFYRYFNKFVGVTPSAWVKGQTIGISK